MYHHGWAPLQQMAFTSKPPRHNKPRTFTFKSPRHNGRAIHHHDQFLFFFLCNVLQPGFHVSHLRTAMHASNLLIFWLILRWASFHELHSRTVAWHVDWLCFPSAFASFHDLHCQFPHHQPPLILPMETPIQRTAEVHKNCCRQATSPC